GDSTLILEPLSYHHDLRAAAPLLNLTQCRQYRQRTPGFEIRQYVVGLGIQHDPQLMFGLQTIKTTVKKRNHGRLFRRCRMLGHTYKLHPRMIGDVLKGHYVVEDSPGSSDEHRRAWL